MICPYLGCGGEAKVTTIVGHCQKCAQPVFLCPECQTVNRSFARYCRNCKEWISLPVVRVQQLLQESEDIDFTKESRRIDINDPFWIAPVGYQGFLWCLSVNGNVWKVSPFSNHAAPFGLMNGESGKSPFIIREIVTDAHRSDWMPYLLAVSPESAHGINLLTKESREFLRTSPDERILSSLEEGFMTLEAQDTSVYFLKTTKRRLCLTSLDLITGDSEDFLLDESRIAGPFKLGNRIGVYSKDSLYLLEDGTLNAHPLPHNFRAWTSPSDIKDLQPHFGRTLYLVRGDALYIPGLITGVPGFLFVSIQGSSPTFTSISIEGEASYTQDSTGRLILAKSGEVVVYEGPAIVAKRRDSELSGRGIPFYDEPITIGRARSAGGFESLRFFSNGEMKDYPLANLYGFIESIGFYCLAEALVFAYLSKHDHIRIVVWDF